MLCPVEVAVYLNPYTSLMRSDNEVNLEKQTNIMKKNPRPTKRYIAEVTQVNKEMRP